MKLLLLTALLFCGACISTPIQQKRDRIIECVKDLHNNDISEQEAFTICSQVYRL